MNQDERQALEDQYRAKVKEMDAESEQWAAERKAGYNDARDNFMRELDTWKDRAESEWDEFKANLEQGWHGLRAKWHSFSGNESEAAEQENFTDDIDDSQKH